MLNTTPFEFKNKSDVKFYIRLIQKQNKQGLIDSVAKTRRTLLKELKNYNNENK